MNKKFLHPHHKLPGKKPATLSLLMLMAFGFLGAVLMTPALPTISVYFHIPIHIAKLTVTFYLIGYAIGQLIYGPIANRFGRKKSYYIGLSVASLGTIFSILSSTFESFPLLLIGRFVEALGMSAGVVLSFTVVGDFYHKKKAQVIVSILFSGLSIMGGVAVAIGGFLTQHISWQSCFYFLLIYGAFLYLPALLLPETATDLNKKATKASCFIRSYLSSLKDPGVLICSLIAGLTASCIYIFLEEAPIIAIVLLKIPPASYGMLAFVPFIGVLAAGIISFLYSRKSEKTSFLIHVGYGIQVFFALLLLTLFLKGEVTKFTLILPTLFILLGTALVSTKMVSTVVAHAKDKATASGLMTFMRVALPAIATFFLALIDFPSPVIFPLFLLALISLSLLIYLWAKASKRINI